MSDSLPYEVPHLTFDYNSAAHHNAQAYPKCAFCIFKANNIAIAHLGTFEERKTYLRYIFLFPFGKKPEIIVVQFSSHIICHVRVRWIISTSHRVHAWATNPVEFLGITRRLRGEISTCRIKLSSNNVVTFRRLLLKGDIRGGSTVKPAEYGRPAKLT